MDHHKPSLGSRDLAKAEFDADFYRETYAGIEASIDPLDHFLTIGWVQGRDPSPDFSVFNYLLRNDDVLYRHLNPFVHYLASGRSEGRQPFKHIHESTAYLPWDNEVADMLPMWFDEDYYLKLNPELAGAPSYLAQFLVLGWVEGRDPCAAFSTHKYLWKYSDVWLAGLNPLIHFLRIGQAEGREISPAEGSRYKIPRHISEAEWLDRVKSEFNAEFYASMYPSTSTLPDLFGHYRNIGWLEGRDPNAGFSVRKYLARHRDVHSSGQEPFYHFVRYGIFEGREVFDSDAVPELDVTDQPQERTADDLAVKAEFDEIYYLRTYPELAVVQDCFQHYMTIGWKEGRNPSCDFDTAFYLRNEGDIREAGINPFRHYILHGKREGRRAVHRIPKLVDQKTFPRVSVIVPNYNHARFLPERLKSIVEQEYPNMELIILDDCSSDNSREVIQAFADSYKGECLLAFNDVNSRNVFAQWQKGLSLASGELIWICESDDTCDAEFLHQTTYLFQDPSVRLVFGNIQFMDADGNVSNGMTHLRESAQPGIWNEINIMPAAKWFTGPLAVRNLMANVGGVVLRKPHLEKPVWDMVRTYRVAGDWYLYVIIAGGGQIAYAPDAKAYFRQHESNTSVAAFNQVSFYEELGRFHTFLRKQWAVPREATFRFYDNMIDMFEHSQLAATHDLANIVSLDKLMRVNKNSVHMAISLVNFNVGGGEIFPIEMMNVLHKRGFVVSAVVQTLESNNSFVRNWLHPDIPVYVSELSPVDGQKLAADAGYDIIHSHNIWSEFYFLSSQPSQQFKYYVTLHGSYEVSHVQRNQIEKFFDQITWAYLADRNLEKFHQFQFDTSGFKLIPNGLARRLSPTPVTRAGLEISQESTVFLFAARSHPEKGWLQAAAAFNRLCAETDRDITLVMAGDGREAEMVGERYGDNSRIKLLGFRGDVDDLLEISNFMLLPTRFLGESMPLTLIQSILASVPIISTDVGQIRDMIQSETGTVGAVIEPTEDEEVFVAALLAEMRKAVSGELSVNATSFATLSSRFSIETCVDKYLELFGLSDFEMAQQDVKAPPPLPRVTQKPATKPGRARLKRSAGMA